MGSPSEKEFKLKRLAWAREYVKDGNAAQATIRAGYSPKCCRRTANRMLKDPMVMAEVHRRMKRLSEECDCTVKRILTELARVAFADITTVIRVDNGRVTVVDTDSLTPDQRAAIAEVSESKDGVKVKNHDKIRALELMGKHLKLFTDRTELAGDPEAPLVVVQPPHGP